MDRFKKEIGIKSKNTLLYERMIKLDNKIESVVSSQQRTLKDIVRQLTQYFSQRPDSVYPTCITIPPAQLELFYELLRKTASLSKSLDVYRICCNRLIATEDEKNTIGNVAQLTKLGLRFSLQSNKSFRCQSRSVLTATISSAYKLNGSDWKTTSKRSSKNKTRCVNASTKYSASTNNYSKPNSDLTKLPMVRSF